MDYYYYDKADIGQLERIKRVLINIKNKGMDCSNVSYSYLRQYLAPKDIFLFYEMVSMKEKTELKSKLVDIGNNFKCNITPYSILNIEEREYSNEELLSAVGKRINFIKIYETNKQKMKKEIDIILDAYNDIIKTKQMKK